MRALLWLLSLSSLATLDAFAPPTPLPHAIINLRQQPISRAIMQIPEDELPPPIPQPPPPPPPPPDKFIPLFVTVALGGYGLILALDAAINGFCIPFVGACFGAAVQNSDPWGSF